jgi:hypothetical protein
MAGPEAPSHVPANTLNPLEEPDVVARTGDEPEEARVVHAGGPRQNFLHHAVEHDMGIRPVLGDGLAEKGLQVGAIAAARGRLVPDPGEVIDD